MFDARNLIEPDVLAPLRYIGSPQLHAGVDAFALMGIAKHLHVRPFADHAIAAAAVLMTSTTYMGWQLINQ